MLTWDDEVKPSLPTTQSRGLPTNHADERPLFSATIPSQTGTPQLLMPQVVAQTHATPVIHKVRSWFEVDIKKLFSGLPSYNVP